SSSGSRSSDIIIGGIAAVSGECHNSFNTGNIHNANSKDAVGGIVGWLHHNLGNHPVKIKGCYNSGNVTGTHRVGGITGSGNSYNADNTMIIENCYNTGSLSVTSSTSTSSIGIGGIIGYFALNDPIYNPKGTIKQDRKSTRLNSSHVK